jgi:hypothetical protein
LLPASATTLPAATRVGTRPSTPSACAGSSSSAT